MRDEEAEKELFIRFTDYSDNFQEEFGSGYYFARIDENIVFYLEVSPISKKGILSLSYATLPEYRRMGYASHILKEVMDVLFQNLGVQEIHLTVLPDNVASVSLAHKLVFVKEKEDEFTYIFLNPLMHEKKENRLGK